MSISPISPDPYKPQAPAPAAPASAAPGNSDSAGGVISQLQKLIEEFKAQLEKGNISLTQMNNLMTTISSLEAYMAELQNGTLTPANAKKMLVDMKTLYNDCNGPSAPPGAKKIWQALETQFDTAINNVKLPTPIPDDLKFFPLFKTLLVLFMKDPNEASPGDLDVLANCFSAPPPASSLNSLVSSNTSIRNLVGAFSAAIDETLSSGDNLSQQLSTLLSQIQNMIEELAKAQGQIEQKFYQTLMQQIKLAQP